jgi:AraC-like DNA-binding protein
MAVEFTELSFLNLAVIITGITLVTILWIFPRSNDSSNKVLAASMLCIIWSVVMYFLLETRLILIAPHFYRTGHAAALIAFPLFYLYVRQYVTQEHLRRADLIHTIPLLIFLIDYAPFFLLSASEKTAIIQNDITDLKNINSFDEGWLSVPYFHYVFRQMVLLLYLALQVRIIYTGLFQRPADSESHGSLSKVWLLVLVGLQFLSLVPYLIPGAGAVEQWRIAILSAGLPVIALTLWLLFKPEILYGIRMRSGAPDHNNDGKAIPEAQKVSRPPTAEEKELAEKLHKHMVASRKFLQHRYTINNLASELHIPPHQVSIFLNQHLNTSFNDFVNKYRVEYAMERINLGDARILTLEALSSECGFNNRNSFTAAFKRVTGATPSQYMRRTEKSSNS